MLDVSWNTVGDDGAAALAAAIEDGMNLLTLKLDHASVGRRGVIVLAESLWHNKSLTHLSLNGTSSLGEDGLKAVMQAVCMSRPADGLRVSLVGADTTVWRAAGCAECPAQRRVVVPAQTPPTDSDFDPARPGGTYSFELSNPFERATAKRLLRSVASCPGATVTSLAFKERATSKGAPVSAALCDTAAVSWYGSCTPWPGVEPQRCLPLAHIHVGERTFSDFRSKPACGMPRHTLATAGSRQQIRVPSAGFMDANVFHAPRPYTDAHVATDDALQSLLAFVSSWRDVAGETRVTRRSELQLLGIAADMFCVTQSQLVTMMRRFIHKRQQLVLVGAYV